MRIVMKKLIIILILTSVTSGAFSQLITYSFLPQVNNGNGTQTLTITATSNANIAIGSWSTGRMGFRIPLPATGQTEGTYGQNFGANGNNPDANFTAVSFFNGAAGGFSDPIGGTTGITTFLLADVGGINDGFLYIGFNWNPISNSAMTNGVPVTVLSFRVPSSWYCTQCFEFIYPPIVDKLGQALSAQFDLSISQSNVGGGTPNIALGGINGSLPVTFSSYNVKCNDKGVLLTWTTASEQNSDRFEIQRSVNGIDWKVVGSVSGAVNSADTRSYQYLDISGGGASQFRIRQVDRDGRYVYTSTRTTNCKISLFDVTLYPVPAKDMLTVVIKSDQAIRTDLQIVDINGRIVNRTVTQINKGNNNITLNVSQLPGGEYMLTSSDPSLIINRKFTVIR